MVLNLKTWFKKATKQSAKQKVYYGKCCRCKGGIIGTRGNSCYANDSNCCGKNKKSNKSNKSRQKSNSKKNSKSKKVDRSKRTKNKK